MRSYVVSKDARKTRAMSILQDKVLGYQKNKTDKEK